jgi:hypothetical protein
MKLKRLEKMRSGGTRTKMQLSIPIPKTPEGRVYWYLPNADNLRSSRQCRKFG